MVMDGLLGWILIAAIVGVILIVVRLFGVWMLRINEVISSLEELVELNKKINNKIKHQE